MSWDTRRVVPGNDDRLRGRRLYTGVPAAGWQRSVIGGTTTAFSRAAWARPVRGEETAHAGVSGVVFVAGSLRAVWHAGPTGVVAGDREPAQEVTGRAVAQDPHERPGAHAVG